MKVIDLFSGVGGLSLGAARSGFDVAVSVELDPHASASHAYNFPKCIHLRSDINALSGTEILQKANLDRQEIVGVIGGPPCQGFSSIGKRDMNDHRNHLFDHFFRLVSELQPAFFLAENVPGILAERYKETLNTAFARVRDHYEILEPLTVKASDYGAATLRKRVFFIGYKPNRFAGNFTHEDFLPSQLIRTTNVETALKGLPSRIDPRWQTEQLGFRKVGSIGDGPFFSRVIGHIPRGVGDQIYLARLMDNGLTSGCMGTVHSAEIKNRYRSLKFGEQDPISKSTKLNPLGFCPTLRAGTGSDKGSFQAVRPIHFRSARVITPREAARLQGFPDWFRFHETKWHSFRQIGNSVSPIVAEEILSVINARVRD